MKYTNYLFLGLTALVISSCGNSKTTENKSEAPQETTVTRPVEETRTNSPQTIVDTALATTDTVAVTMADSASIVGEEDSFYDDIDFDWRGKVSHEMYDDYTYEQLMSDAEIDKIINESKRKYYHESKVKKILEKDSKTMTMDELKEAIEELKYISIHDILWARAQLEIEHMKTTGEMDADDYSHPKTACQKAYWKASENANHGIMDISFNVSKLVSMLRFADLDLEAKKAFYEAKKLRAYYGKVLNENNRLYKERTEE